MQVQSLAIDGLDGSGKASCVNELSRLLARSGYNVISTAFPQYDTYIGAMLKRIQFGEIHCSQEQKMALYCLNRLETVRPINALIQQLTNQNKLDTILLFDRFSSSSILTYAYETVEREIDQQDLEYTYTHMWELDTPFLDGLSLHTTSVYIPYLPARDAMSSASNDTSRAALDLNEVHSVQHRANELYTAVADYDPRIKRISQYVGTVRESPSQIAQRIFDLEKLVQHPGAEMGVIYELNLQPEKIERSLVHQIEENMIDDHISYLLEDCIT